MDQSFLQAAFVFLMAACLLVPLTQLAGLGSVIGYLAAGVLLGPFGIGLIQEPSSILHFSEFGVVMMLFIIGLEMRPAQLWEMSGRLMGLGGLQVLLSTVALGALAWLTGWSLGESAVIGMALSLSSTAIAMQIIQERGIVKTTAGQSAFSVLLFQDIVVIAMIAAIPVLAHYSPVVAPAIQAGHGHESHGPQGWMLAVAIVAAFGGMFIAGRLLLRPLFRLIAKSRVRETFTAVSLLLVIGAAQLMEWLSLSAALGTFIAGMVLADSEYRHQLERDIEPFKALLLGLFFMSVGMSLDFNTLAEQPGLIAAAVALLIPLKFLVLLFVGRLFQLCYVGNVLFASLLSQAGEFGFVLFQFAFSAGATDAQTVSMLNAVIALSMALTPLVLIAYDRFARVDSIPSSKGAEGPTKQDHRVLVLGFGRVGQMVVRLLQSQDIDVTIIDHDANQIELAGQWGFKVFYGDAADIELLRAAGASEATVVVSAIDDVSKATQAAKEIKTHFPAVKLLARARNRSHLFDLLDEDVDFIERETVRGALSLGRVALQFLGYDQQRAERMANQFLTLDYKIAEDTYHLKDDMPALIERSSQGLALLRETLNQEREQKQKR